MTTPTCAFALALVLALTGCEAATVANAERLMDEGKPEKAREVALRALGAAGEDPEAAKRILDELELRKVASAADPPAALQAATFHGAHAKEQAEAHVVRVVREAVAAGVAKNDAEGARRSLDRAPEALKGQLVAEETRVLVLEVETCAAAKMANCAKQGLERLRALDAAAADAESQKLATGAWDDEVQAWRAFNRLDDLQSRSEACGRLRAATALSTALDEEHHKAAHAEHLAACDRVAKALAAALAQAQARVRAADAEEARHRREEARAEARAAASASAPLYRPASFSSSSGPHCKKGCACGGACISCSKHCRH